MATVDLQLDSHYAAAGSVVTATGGPYTVASNLKITVQDTDEAAVRSDLGTLIVSGTPTSIPNWFGKTMTGIDMQNTTTKQTILTVPTGSRAIITQVIVREATSDASACSFAFGFDASAADVVATATIGALTTGSGFPVGQALISLGGAAIGESGDVFGTQPTIASAAPGTCTVDVIGYYI